MWNWNIKKILIGLSIICLSAGITGFLSSCSRGESAEEALVVACGDDLAGIVVQSVVEPNNITIEKLGMDYMSVGDCCGSNAQFALSAEEVDIAVLCPDAVKNLQDAGKDYEVLGIVVYDGNVFVRRADSLENPEVIGYMNKRTEQLELLQEIYGTDKNYRPVFASALSPVVNSIRQIPIMAWVPLSIIWFGLGEGPTVFLIFMSAVFPLIINTIAGVAGVDENYINAARSMGANTAAIYRDIIIPGTLPGFLTGCRLAVGAGWMSVICAEFIATSKGFGI